MSTQLVINWEEKYKKLELWLDKVNAEHKKTIQEIIDELREETARSRQLESKLLDYQKDLGLYRRLFGNMTQIALDLHEKRVL